MQQMTVQDMNTTGISDKAWTPYRPNLDGTSNQRLQHFQAFRTALLSGNLAGAQQAFAPFQKDMQTGLQNLAEGGATSQHAQATKDLQTMGDALGKGDIAGAQQAFVALKQDLQAVYSRHVHHAVRADAASAQAAKAATPAPTSGVEPRGEFLNTYA